MKRAVYRYFYRVSTEGRPRYDTIVEDDAVVTTHGMGAVQFAHRINGAERRGTQEAPYAVIDEMSVRGVAP